MGTNYYAIPKVSDDLKLKIIQAVINNQIEDLKKLVPVQIHLGKSSFGWPFMFNHNNWEYYNTINDLTEFISTCNITDEYGKCVSSQYFKDLVEDKQKIGVEKLTDYCFIKDGYVFSTSSEFS